MLFNSNASKLYKVCIYEKALQLSIGRHNLAQHNLSEQEKKKNVKEETENSLPDETAINNIDLGGILNLATEDTLNIR